MIHSNWIVLKRKLVGLSTVLNLLAASTVLILVSGVANNWIFSALMKNVYEQKVSLWDTLPIGSRDAVFLGDSNNAIYVQSILSQDKSYRISVEQVCAQLMRKLGGRAIWVDLYRSFIDENDGSIRNEYGNDELHMLGSGYLLWLRKISAFIKE